ncbi:hypothetical protein FSP39_022565 [Pinctada imbricata]|uniref:Cytochrome b561 domain-containing protein n=1 Tax=Pinctada imbricata TaxID=66713 RepID=A0AA88Y1M8_PINIB|nr:hypothetical protein FSP39_022565 [Pinctada imbricata]
MTYKTTTNTVTFQMFAKGQGYVSIGFSDDQEMGNDQTITCTAGNNAMSIQHGYNPGKFAFRQYVGNQLSNVKIRQVDGMTSCMFTRPKRMAVLNPMAPNGSQLFDLDAEYYVLIAWGSTYPGTDVMVKHMELPIATKTKVDFNTYRIYSAGALPLESQIHGFLMLFAWMICAGLAAIISRYYKVGIGGNIVKGAALWFQSHRIAGLLTFGITAASFILIFIKVDGLTTVAVIHAWFGVALMAITTGQILFGLCRPGPDSRWRPMFNWGHWLSGKTLQILSAATCFLAFYASFIPERQRFYGIIVLSDASEKYDLKDSEKDTSSGDGKVKIFLLLYFLCMVAVLVGGALTIFMF